MHQNNLYYHESSMQAHLASHLQQQNTQELLNQSRIYLDNRRSYSPIENKQQISAQLGIEQRDRKIANLGQQSSGSSLETEFLVEKEENEWRERGRGPRLAHTMPRRGQGCPRAWHGCGHLLWLPSTSLVPLGLKYSRKN